MIADLKKDSQRWEAERRASASRGQPSGGTYSPRETSNMLFRKSDLAPVEYQSSMTHQSRQRYGPSSDPTPDPQAGYGAPASQVQLPQYDQGPVPYQSGYPAPALGQSYTTQQVGYVPPDNNPYYVGGHMQVQPQAAQPRTYAQPSQGYQENGRSNNAYYAQPGTQPSPGPQYPVQQQNSDPYYGRGAFTHRHSPLYSPMPRMTSL
jgi:hypothetical protein